MPKYGLICPNFFCRSNTYLNLPQKKPLDLHRSTPNEKVVNVYRIKNWNQNYGVKN